MNDLINRFCTYVKMDTTADPLSKSVPSSKGQIELANKLKTELLEMGLTVDIDKEGYVYAKLKGNVENVPTVGFIAHLDTAPDITGKNVRPQIIENYDGSIIKLNNEYNLDPIVFPSLLNYVGKTLITTDGTTLLGADDKAGITIIMELVKYLVDNPDTPHGDVAVGFTIDEEIGTDADFFNIEKFGADFAYTVDGGVIGEFQYENFNAASCTIKINGINVHPGTAKNQMVNATSLGINFDRALTIKERPEYTELYEAFYHCTDFNGTCESAVLNYIIREHDFKKFEEKKKHITDTFEVMIKKYSPTSEIVIEDSYFNMKDKVLTMPRVIELATKAMENANVSPRVEPVRGGTDGARLSFMGLICPNIFTGGHNYHGRFEYVCAESMVKGVDSLKEIIILNTKL